MQSATSPTHGNYGNKKSPSVWKKTSICKRNKQKNHAIYRYRTNAIPIKVNACPSCFVVFVAACLAGLLSWVQRLKVVIVPYRTVSTRLSQKRQNGVTGEPDPQAVAMTKRLELVSAMGGGRKQRRNPYPIPASNIPWPSRRENPSPREKSKMQRKTHKLLTAQEHDEPHVVSSLAVRKSKSRISQSPTPCLKPNAETKTSYQRFQELHATRDQKKTTKRRNLTSRRPQHQPTPPCRRPSPRQRQPSRNPSGDPPPHLQVSNPWPARDPHASIG